jgi:hypothetical protein
MLRLTSATFALALGAMTAFAGQIQAAEIAEPAVLESVAPAAAPAEDRIELVSTTSQVGTLTTTSAASVPAPAALALFGIGLLGLAGARRLRRG